MWISLAQFDVITLLNDTKLSETDAARGVEDPSTAVLTPQVEGVAGVEVELKPSAALILGPAKKNWCSKK